MHTPCCDRAGWHSLDNVSSYKAKYPDTSRHNRNWKNKPTIWNHSHALIAAAPKNCQVKPVSNKSLSSSFLFKSVAIALVLGAFEGEDLVRGALSLSSRRDSSFQ